LKRSNKLQKKKYLIKSVALPTFRSVIALRNLHPTASVKQEGWVSSFLTAHQHILGYSVLFIHSMLFTVW